MRLPLVRLKTVFCVLLLSLLTACSNQPYVIPSLIEDSPIRENKVYVISHGWHTGFVISAKEIQHNIHAVKERFVNTPYIEFGWGDKGFYQADEVTSSLTLQAIFWPSGSVIHAVAVPDSPKKYFINSDIIELCLSENEYRSLIKFISSSFARDENNNVIPLKKGIYGNSQFYKAVGDYYLMNTCNKWTAKGLASSGFDLFTTFKLTSSSIMDYLEDEKTHRINSCAKQYSPSSNSL